MAKKPTEHMLWFINFQSWKLLAQECAFLLILAGMLALAVEIGGVTYWVNWGISVVMCLGRSAYDFYCHVKLRNKYGIVVIYSLLLL